MNDCIIQAIEVYLLFIIINFGKSSSAHFLLAGGYFFLSAMLPPWNSFLKRDAGKNAQ